MFERIHKKPRALRERYAFWSAFSVTALIALVWVVSLQYRIGDGFSDTDEVAKEYGGAFSQFFGEAKDRAAAAFSATTEEIPAATSTEEREERPAFEFLTSSSTDTVQIEGREVRIRTATSSEQE